MPRAIDVVDVFAYTTVLALFVEFAPDIISESFLVSFVTAIVLKLVLELAVAAKTRIVKRIRAAQNRRGRIVSTAALMLTAGASKFLILWLTDLVLGDAVHLGGFLSVTVLVIALMLTRELVRRAVRPSSLTTSA
ncbi:MULTISPECIES: hypothetical protein [unclassified Microbacterium]|uniref:hypothetical protein n=1 Tax=unclassified Microbacterium TaxID=2609290 RepID=UPI001DD555A2|nr:hypothetical protein [Microbacterium sp. Bi121]CAH0122968.1 hypothetical protein SRABI121_00140 [Microbacterium sp. Bi121]